MPEIAACTQFRGRGLAAPFRALAGSGRSFGADAAGAEGDAEVAARALAEALVDDVEVGVGVGCSGAAGLLGAGAAASIGGASAGGSIHAAWRVTAATRPGRQVSALRPVPSRGAAGRRAA